MAQSAKSRLVQMAALAALTSLTCMSAHAGDGRQFVEGVFTLGPGPQGCLLLQNDEESFALSSTDILPDGWNMDDVFYVSGTVDPDVTLCFPFTIAALSPDTTVSFGVQGFFTVGGVLQSGCRVLSNDKQTIAVLPEDLPADTKLFGLSVVYVEGAVGDNQLCFPGPPALENATILPAVQDFFTLGGVLQSGCRFLSNSTTSVVIQPQDIPAEAMTGDVVYVQGAMGDNQFCFPGPPALEHVTVLPAVEDYFNVTGFLQSGCVFLASETSSATVQPDDLPRGFEIGDLVFVQGTIGDKQSCFPGPSALENVNALPAYEGCGNLTPGPQSCLGFTGDDGEGFILADYDGTFAFGADVFLRGAIMTSENFCFPVGPVTLLTNISVFNCPGAPGDLDVNGVVDGSDLLLLLNAWGSMANVAGVSSITVDPADLDNSGIVGGNDLLILLNNWGEV